MAHFGKDLALQERGPESEVLRPIQQSSAWWQSATQVLSKQRQEDQWGFLADSASRVKIQDQ